MTSIFVLSIAYVLSQFYRVFLAVLTPVLSSELGMSEWHLSLASGAWFATFAFAQFPIGIWLDKFGPRRTVSILLAVFGGGGALLFANASSPQMVIIAMAMIGIGCAPVLMASFVILARNYSASIFATLAATFISVGMIGSVVGAEPLAAAVHLWGWREVATGLALITAFIAVVLFFIVKDPKHIENTQDASFFDLLKIKQLWLLFPIITFSYCVSAGIRGLWSGPFLEQVYGLDILEIGRIVLYMSFAQIIGTLAYGPMDRIFDTRKWVVVGGNSVLLACCIWLAVNEGASLTGITIVFVVIGLFGSASTVQAAHGKAFIPMHMIGRGMTLLNFFSIGGAALMQVLSGGVYDRWSRADDPFAGFGAIFYFYAIMLAVALSIYLFSKDAKPRQE